MRRLTTDRLERHATGEVHCEPTWNVSPYGRSPSSRASSISERATPASAPNFRDRGNRLLPSSTRTRT